MSELIRKAIPVAIWCASALLPGYNCLAADSDTGDPHTIEIFYGTDRELLGADATGVRFGVERGKVSYGIVRFEMRSRASWGEEGRGEVAKIVAATNGAKEVQLILTRHMSPAKFFATLRDPDRSGRPDEIMLMVHGFKRDFDTAAENAARLASITGFPGRTVLWSWPSQDNPAAYLTDRTSLRWSENHLARFIQALVQETGMQQLVLVAHSLGAQGLSFALFEKIGAARIGAWPVKTNLVLLAPDIDLAIFRRDIVPGLVAANVPTTLYTSASDRALIASSKVNGYPRVGDSSDGVHTFEGVETVDATRAFGSYLGHSYYRRSSTVADDLRALIVQRQPASLRPGLARVEINGVTYWQLVE
jgi:esterase/lipase superfamily enzyme